MWCVGIFFCGDGRKRGEKYFCKERTKISYHHRIKNGRKAEKFLVLRWVHPIAIFRPKLNESQPVLITDYMHSYILIIVHYLKLFRCGMANGRLG